MLRSLLTARARPFLNRLVVNTTRSFLRPFRTLQAPLRNATLLRQTVRQPRSAVDVTAFLFRGKQRIPNARSHGRRFSTESGEGQQLPQSPRPLTQSKPISYWLFACCGVVFAIVVLGGATRLTRAGLSMTDWKPHGGLPPMTDDEWDAEFEKYKQFPEFKRLNSDMTLSEFKFIYFMEYSHRMAGRMAGIVFSLPFAYFAIRGRLNAPLMKRLGAALFLGANQGMVGWWMVKSGLEEPPTQYHEPKVSPYRLTMHLTLAFGIYALLFDTAMKTYPAKSTSLLHRAASCSPALRRFTLLTAAVLAITVQSGAFVAGNRAGYVYNEFPLMGGRIIPQDIFEEGLTPLWRNAFENPVMVQFDHRYLALTTLTLIGMLAHRAVKTPNLPRASRFAIRVLGAGAVAQVTLGISTLLTLVPVHLGVAHQAGALSLLSVALWVLHTLGPAAPVAGATTAALALLAIPTPKDGRQDGPVIELVEDDGDTSEDEHGSETETH